MEEFKKNDYIVLCLNETKCKDDNWNNVCFKQRKTDCCLLPILDLNGYTNNGWSKIKFESKLWRYATENEIKHYDLINKPFNVNNIVSSNNNYTNLLTILKFIQNHENIFNDK